MTNTLVTTTDKCATWPGQGVATTWTLEGSYLQYDGYLADTDGYKITVSQTWRTLTSYAYTQEGTITAMTSTGAVIGTCVETLDSRGLPLTEGTNDQGNFAICHWMYFTGNSDESWYNNAFMNDGSA